MTDYTYTTGAPSTNTLTAGDLLKVMREVMRNVPEEPIAAYMRERGFDPLHGGVLYLPDSLRSYFPSPFLPDYIKFSGAITRPVMTWIPRMFPAPWEQKEI